MITEQGPDQPLTGQSGSADVALFVVWFVVGTAAIVGLSLAGGVGAGLPGAIAGWLLGVDLVWLATLRR